MGLKYRMREASEHLVRTYNPFQPKNQWKAITKMPFDHGEGEDGGISHNQPFIVIDEGRTTPYLIYYIEHILRDCPYHISIQSCLDGTLERSELVD